MEPILLALGIISLAASGVLGWLIYDSWRHIRREPPW
jgi:hypothetical protein